MDWADRKTREIYLKYLGTPVGEGGALFEEIAQSLRDARLEGIWEGRGYAAEDFEEIAKELKKKSSEKKPWFFAEHGTGHN